MKKIVSLLLAVVIVVSVFFVVPSTAFALQSDVAQTSATSGDFEYIVLSDGTAEITDYTGYAKSLVIPSTIDDYIVTSIGDRAFASCKSLVSVTIGESVKNIGAWAFNECLSLSEITIHSSVIDIGGGAFSKTVWYVNQPDGCLYINGLLYSYKGYMPEDTEIVIEDGTTQICDRAFYHCSQLSSITIPDSVTRIGEYALYSCSGLESVTIPPSVKSIGRRAFASCSSLKSIMIPDLVTSIEEYTFSHCYKLTEVVIGDSVTSIGDKAFSYCNNLKIYGYNNTVAQSYADDNEIEFVSLDEQQNYLLGDIDGDEDITIIDATIIQRHIAQLVTIVYDRRICADVDKDTNITVVDATIIQKFVAQLIPLL